MAYDSIWAAIQNTVNDTALTKERKTLNQLFKEYIKEFVNGTVDSDTCMPLDTLISQIVYGTASEFTDAGTYTIRIPYNVNSIKVTACGGGAGGNGGCTASIPNGTATLGGAGGGGGAAIVDNVYSVTPCSQCKIVVGKGGIGGKYSTTMSESFGYDGEATYIENIVTLNGGKAGSVVSDSQSETGGKSGGTGGGDGGNTTYSNATATNGNSGVTGNGGVSGTTYNSPGKAKGMPGGGGGGSLGNGGNGGSSYRNSASNGANGIRGGGGGGASTSIGGESGTGGNGGDGYVKITYIYN